MAVKTKINDHGDVIFSEEDAIELLYTDPNFDISKLYFDDTATYDQELDKGIYTGHFSWNNQKIPVDNKHEYHAKVFEFQPKVLDGGKDKNK